MKESHRKFLNPIYTNYIKEEIKARSKQWIQPARVSGFICPCCHSGDGPHGTGIMESKKYPNQFRCYSSRTGECWDGYQDIIGIVRHMYKVSFYDALELAAEKVGYEFPDPELFKEGKPIPEHTVPVIHGSTGAFAQPSPPKQEEIDAVQQELAAYRNNLDKTDYYRKRGLSRETVERFGCGFAPHWQHPLYANLDVEKERQRLISTLKNEGYEESWNNICKATKDPYLYMRKYHPSYLSSHYIHLLKPFPSDRFIIPTSDGSYVARLTTPIVKDYQKRSAKIKVGKQITGFNWNALKQKKAPVIITEGEFDALSIEELGYPSLALGSVTMMSNFCTYITETKIKPAFPLIIVLDNDTTGRSWTIKMIDSLRKINIFAVSGENILLTGTKDPNESLCKDREEFSKRVKDVIEDTKSLQAKFAVSRGV